MYFSKEVSQQELLRMREEEGMSNHEIADRLDVSYNTILRLIGKQPASVRRKPADREGGYIPHSRRVIKSTVPDFPNPAPEQPAASACLVVENRTISLVGVYGSYSIQVQQKEINVETQSGTMVVPFEKLKDFVAELSAISDKLPTFRIENEMW